jgi:hypothetical protein
MPRGRPFATCFVSSDVSLVLSFSPQVCVEVSKMKFPMVGQRVTIKRQGEVYLVLRVDLRRYAADLMLMTGTHELEQNVPFVALEPARQKTVRPREKSEVS